MGSQCSSESPRAPASGFGASRGNRAWGVLDLQTRFNADAVPRLPHHRSAFLRLLRLLAAIQIRRKEAQDAHGVGAVLERIAPSDDLRIWTLTAKLRSGRAGPATAVQRVRRASPTPSSLRFLRLLRLLAAIRISRTVAQDAHGAPVLEQIAPTRRPQDLDPRGETALGAC
jgi:hypothetical protein